MKHLQEIIVTMAKQPPLFYCLVELLLKNIFSMTIKCFYVVVLKRFIGVYIIPVVVISPLHTYQERQRIMAKRMQRSFRSLEITEWGEVPYLSASTKSEKISESKLSFSHVYV